MDEYTPRIINSMSTQEAKQALYDELDTFSGALTSLANTATDISPHLAWIINPKMIKIETSVSAIRSAIDAYLSDGVMYD